MRANGFDHFETMIGVTVRNVQNENIRPGGEQGFRPLHFAARNTNRRPNQQAAFFIERGAGMSRGD